MMNEVTRQFVQAHRMEDVRQLALSGAKAEGVDLAFALQQIAGWQTARKKLPSWAATEGLFYPPHLNMEQCSSEQTALYKRSILPVSKGTFVDLTGGFGVDFSWMSSAFDKRIYVERNADLCEVARHNFHLLGLKTEVVCLDAEDYLRQMEHADVVFLDPARRDLHGSRTYGIADCTPNVVELLPLLMEKAGLVVLKLSPMLDWRKAVRDLGEQHVREIHIVSVRNECKELLVVMGQGEGLRLVCVNDASVFELSTDVSAPLCQFGNPCAGMFLYEPNASVMKAGCFAELSQRFGVAPIAQNSHLFVSTDLVVEFPGRTFQIEAVSSLNKRELKERFSAISQANITVRNFPFTVAELRRRLKLNEGGSTYIFATTLVSGDRVLLICRKAM